MVGAGLGIVLVAGAAALFLSRDDTGTPSATPGTSSPSSSPTAPPRIAFVFPLSETTTASTGGGGGAEATAIAVRVQSALSGFYDTAFLNPETWAKRLPEQAWDAFEEPLRPRAQRDADSLTLGEEAAQIATLEATHASLDVRVLFDPKGNPEASVATVVFKAEGTSRSGGGVKVVNRASYIMRPFGEQWLIVGYPSANTRVESEPLPSPSGSASPTQSATP